MYIRPRGHNPELMSEAERIVKPQWPTAVQVENLGTPSKGSAEIAEDVDQWKFIFTDIDDESVITINYIKGKFDKPAREVRRWTETAVKELPRDMTLDQAIIILRGSGYNEPFQSVLLQSPKDFDGHASYIFKMGQNTVHIDAITSEIVKAA